MRSTASGSPSHGRLDAAADGPLAFLAGRPPLMSFVLRDFRMRFGS